MRKIVLLLIDPQQKRPFLLGEDHEIESGFEVENLDYSSTCIKNSISN